MCTKWQLQIGRSQPHVDPHLQWLKLKSRVIGWVASLCVVICGCTMGSIVEVH